MTDLVVVEVQGATVVVQEASPAQLLEVAAVGPQGPQGDKGDKGDKGDTGDVTPELMAAKVAAETAATNAQGSATSASSSATAASASAASATASATSATNSATAASASANAAQTAAATATTKAGEASASAANAAASATSASASAAAATTKSGEASTSATNAAASASSAATSASTASTKASEAASSATSAASSASSAQSSAATATTKASEASTSASNAATSATNAATSASAAAASQTSAATSASTATTQAGIATSKATEAAASATAAANGAASASTSAATATTKASEASSSASSAAAARLAAETARDQALAAFDNFDDKYLGEKASDPTTDNDGNPLIVGALYFNTQPLNSGGGMKVYGGSGWLAAYSSLSGALIAASNLADLTNVVSARSNLGLGNVENKSSAAIRSELTSGNVTSALGFTPYNAASLSADLAPYLLSATASSTYQPILVSGASIKTVNGQSVLGSGNIQIDGGVTSFNARTGAVTLSSSDVTGALGFAPASAASLATVATSGSYNDLLGKPTLFSGAYADLTGKPANVSFFTNDAGYLTSITGSQVTSALGYTPYNAGSLSGDLAPYLLSATAASTYQPILVSGTSIKTVNGQSVLGSGNIQIDGGVVSFNTRTGAITLTSADVTGALGFTPAALQSQLLAYYPYTATAGQTTFSGAASNGFTLSYTPGGILVTLNGVVLDASEYTASNGTSVVLASGASVGDVLAVHAFQTATVANTYTQGQTDSLLAAKLSLSGGTMSGAITFAAGQTFPGAASTGKAIAMAIVFGG